MPSTYFMAPAQVRAFRTALLRWYDTHSRDLPWRRTTDPYRVWVSEIMLQQTRVSAVLEHYRRFIQKFPTARSLAKAKLADVLAVWSGLGYYRRARAMHEAAQQVVERYGGKLPATLDELRALPGIGRYTSAAIGSIAFGIPAAVVDGNVERVLARVGGRAIDRSEVWEIAQQCLNVRRPGDWNQAMMELGATGCTPVAPKCVECPVKRWCKAPGADTRTPDAPRQKRQRIVGLATKRDAVYLVQRSERESLMAGMWELPEVKVDTGAQLARVKHSITITDFDVLVLAYSPNGDRRGKWVKTADLHICALTGLARKILRGANLLTERANQTTKR